MAYLPIAERFAITINEACQFSGIGRSKLYEELKDSKIASTQSGTRRLVIVSSLVEYLRPKSEQKEGA